MIKKKTAKTLRRYFEKADHAERHGVNGMRDGEDAGKQLVEDENKKKNKKNLFIIKREKENNNNNNKSVPYNRKRGQTSKTDLNVREMPPFRDRNDKQKGR